MALRLLQSWIEDDDDEGVTLYVKVGCDGGGYVPIESLLEFTISDEDFGSYDTYDNGDKQYMHLRFNDEAVHIVIVEDIGDGEELHYEFMVLLPLVNLIATSGIYKDVRIYNDHPTSNSN